MEPCSTCVYWKPLPADDQFGEVKLGRCRRYAPGRNGGYPLVWSGCGEHSPKPDTAAGERLVEADASN